MDYLRVFSIAVVIFLHVSAQNWSGLNGRSFEWNVFNFYDGITRWCVPVFIMISGALFLSREVELKILYSKNILRLFIAYCVWLVFYAVSESVGNQFSWENIIKDILEGPIHMWFIPMLISLYICVPILKQIVKKEEITKYFLMLSFVFTLFIPQIVRMSNDFVGGWFSAGVSKANELLGNMSMDLVKGYSFYFVLGYYLNKTELTKRQRKAVYIMGIIGLAATVLLNALMAWQTEKTYYWYYGNFTVNVALEAIAVFTWFKYKDFKNEKMNDWICKLAKYSFGVYLVHIFVRDVLDKIGLDTLTFNPIISVPIISILVIAISYVISCIINKIPGINKWIV